MHLLRSQCYTRGGFRRQRQRFIHRVCVQRLCSSKTLPPAPEWSFARRLLRAVARLATNRPSECGSASISERGSRALKRSRMMRAHNLRAARNFAISSSRLLCELKKNEMRGAKSSICNPGCKRRFDVGDSICECKCHFLHRGRTRFANVITTDRDRVPVRALHEHSRRRCQ